MEDKNINNYQNLETLIYKPYVITVDINHVNKIITIDYNKKFENEIKSDVELEQTLSTYRKKKYFIGLFRYNKDIPEEIVDRIQYKTNYNIASCEKIKINNPEIYELFANHSEKYLSISIYPGLLEYVRENEELKSIVNDFEDRGYIATYYTDEVEGIFNAILYLAIGYKRFYL